MDPQGRQWCSRGPSDQTVVWVGDTIARNRTHALHREESSYTYKMSIRCKMSYIFMITGLKVHSRIEK